MSKTKNEAAEVRRATQRFAQKNRRSRRRLGLEIGDRIRIIDIPPDLKDPNYDLQGPEHRELRTAELFRFCLGREFTVQDFGKYGTVELDVGTNRTVRKEFGWSHTIFIEPAHLDVVRKKRGTKSRVSGLSK